MSPFVATRIYAPDAPLLVLAFLPGGFEAIGEYRTGGEIMAVCVKPGGDMVVEPVEGLRAKFGSGEWPFIAGTEFTAFASDEQELAKVGG